MFISVSFLHFDDGINETSVEKIQNSLKLKLKNQFSMPNGQIDEIFLVSFLLVSNFI